MNLANFRELGGIETLHGQKVRTDRLLRSGEVYQVNQASLERLANHQLVKIIDFRSEKEIAERPDDQLQNVAYQWIDIMKEVPKNASLEDLIRDKNAAAVDQHMVAIYEQLAVNAGVQKGYQHFLNTLLTLETGSVLFHCFAGKDRTGIAAALVLELLNVSRENIYADYLKTNQQREKTNHVFLTKAAEQGLNAEQLASIKVALQVKATYLDRWYQVIDQEYGDVKRYAKECLAIGNAEIQQLQQLYLA